MIMVDEQSKAHLQVPLDILVPVICIYLLFHSYYLILTILVYTFFISVQNFELLLGLGVCETYCTLEALMTSIMSEEIVCYWWLHRTALFLSSCVMMDIFA